MGKNQIQLISQALQAAVSSINLAKQMLGELEREVRVSAKDLPGITGTFDGEAMTCPDGKKYQVPENYASKSMLVFGDTLKMVEEGGEKLFKQIERVKRITEAGILAKKEGKWHAVTAEGSYKLLPAAVSFHAGEEGDEVTVTIPQDNRRAPFAALETVKKEGGAASIAAAPKPEAPQVIKPGPAPVAEKTPIVKEAPKKASKPPRKEVKVAEVKSVAPPVEPASAPARKAEALAGGPASPASLGGPADTEELH